MIFNQQMASLFCSKMGRRTGCQGDGEGRDEVTNGNSNSKAWFTDKRFVGIARGLLRSESNQPNTAGKDKEVAVGMKHRSVRDIVAAEAMPACY